MPFAPALEPDPWAAAGRLALYFVAYLLVGLLPVLGFLSLTFHLLTLPMRRNERSRLFLDLLETGMNAGVKPERTVVEAAATDDPALGRPLRRLANHIEKGASLDEALADGPRLLPPQLIAMLKSGERIGDLAKVIPACRQVLNDAVSQVRGALNYLLVIAFVLTPFTVAVPIMINVFIVPRFKEVFAEMAPDASLPALTNFVLAHSRLLLTLQVSAVLLVWALLAAYVGGPGLRAWLARFLPGVPDRIHYCLAWKKKRLQRDFSSILCVLLDSGVPETEAVSLAADSTENLVLRRRAQTVRRQLSSGVRLPTAIRCLDESGELQWRLANALQRGGGFLRALSGWHEALDAKAFQLEQAAAQIMSSALVLFNGVMVAAVVIAMFSALVHLVHWVALW